MAVNSVAFSPDGKVILTGSNDRTARLWSLNGNVIQEFKGHNSSIIAVAFSPDGQHIITGSSDSTARLWNIKGKQIKVLSKNLDIVTTVAFSPDGKTILTGSDDYSARLWDLKGKLLRVFKGHTTTIFSVAFSPDGRKILAGSADQTAILWDLQGNIDQVFSGYKSYVRSVVFSPDGQNILIGLDNGNVRLYPVKMPFQTFYKKAKYEKLSSFDKLIYDITDINKIISSENESSLLQASEYYVNEAIQSGMGEKSKYLNNAIELYNKLLKKDPGRKEYLFDLLRASVYSYVTNPTDQTKKEIAKLNEKIMGSTSIEDLTLAGYTYLLICLKNDLTIDQLSIPECFMAICRKLLAHPDLPEAERKDISRWCSYLSSDFIPKKEFTQALQLINISQLSDSTNKEMQVVLPIVYIFNNQYDKAEQIIREFKNKSLSGIDYFKTYKDIYKYAFDLLEEKAITHPDFAKVKELLKN